VLFLIYMVLPDIMILASTATMGATVMRKIIKRMIPAILFFSGDFRKPHLSNNWTTSQLSRKDSEIAGTQARIWTDEDTLGSA